MSAAYRLNLSNLEKSGSDFVGHYSIDHGRYENSGCNTPLDMADIMADKFGIEQGSEQMRVLEEICQEIAKSQAVFELAINDFQEVSCQAVYS